MRKLLLVLSGIIVSLSLLAQEDDVTHYIQNGGFDEDLTFQPDGAMKAVISTETSLSDRSWAYIAADSTVYAKPKSTSSQQRKDGRSKLDAVNGFIGRVNGWTIETNQEFPKCEWVYFGTVPYALADKSIPIADDGDTYLNVPAKPDADNGDDNQAFAYLRAGWGGRAVYKQTVKLPCAVYRLEYWAININPNGKNGKNLSKVVCRKDTWEDETGFSDTEWTKHTIEFTPTSEFSMQFGFESSGGSGSNPFLCIDGIKLYKIDEADPIKLLEADVQDVISECQALALQASDRMYEGLASVVGDYGYELEDEVAGATQEEMEAALKKANEYLLTLRAAIDEITKVNAILAKIDNLLASTDFAGKEALKEAYNKILGYKENEPKEGDDIVAQILGAVAEGNEAIKAYYMTQEGSEENPADFTVFIKNPWFISSEAEPVLDNGVWVFPNALNEDGTDNYTEGSATSPDLTSEGWVITGASGGDQRLNWQRGRSCWNAWNNNYLTTLSIGQTIEGLPNGYYTVSADLITESGCMNDQHVYALSTAEKKISTATLTSEGWDYNEWETVAMTAADKVLVVDGKLTIGAEGTGTGSGAAGWFLATNFHLYYLGQASDDAVKAAFDKKLATAKEQSAAMHFKGDQKVLNEVIETYAATTDYIAAMTALNTAMEEAAQSEAKYEEYIPADGTIEGKTIPTVQYTLKKNGGEGYGAAEAIVEYAYNYLMGWIEGDTANYAYFDGVVDQLKLYLNTYAPVYNKAAEVAAASSEQGKATVEKVMEEQKAILLADIQDQETVNTFVKELNSIIAVAEKQIIIDNPNATDYTAFIMNPNAEAVDGWTIVLGNGDGNGEKSGQWFDDSSTRYFDSYNSSGLNGFIASQLITDLPNGTYSVGVYTRTPAKGAYIFYAPDAENIWVPIPLDYHQTYTESGEDTLVVASDKYGPIWEEAVKAVEEGTYTDLQTLIYNANGAEGRGWKYQQIDGIVVNNHQLLIGTAAGSEELGTEEVFTGNWYSVGGWTLTLTALGDNTGWEGPLANGIDAISALRPQTDGIYTVSGVRTTKLQRGLNIVVNNGKAQKVLVK